MATFNSAFSIEQRVSFLNNGEPNKGVIVSIEFTKQKVFYHILDDYTAKLIQVDSSDITEQITL